MKQKIEIKMPANLELSSIVRHMAESIYSAVGFSKAWSSRLMLVTDELFMNAVQYGSESISSIISINFTMDDNRVEFEICDDGSGSSHISPEELNAIIFKNENNKDLSKTSGRGLAMIASLWTDGMTVNKSESGGICIRFTKKIDYSPPPLLQPLAPPASVQPVTPVAPVTPAVTGPTVSAPTPSANAPQTLSAVPAPASNGLQVSFELEGDLDQTALVGISDSVSKQIQQLPVGAVFVLDFKKVNYINSTFIGYLAGWHNEVTKMQSTIQLINVNEPIMDVLNLVGLSQLIKISQ